MLQLISFLLFLLAVASAYDVRTPTITNLNPGIRFEYDDSRSDIKLVAFHFSVNKAVSGTGAGDINVDVRYRTGGKYVYENRHTRLNPGDRVNYWVYAVVDKLAYQRLDQTWVVSGGKPINNGNTGTTRNTVNPGNNGNTGNSGSSGNFGSQKRGNRPLGDCSGKACRASQCTSYPCLIFEDNFDTLDTSVWDHEITAGGGGNNEFQYYHNSRTNSYVRDGKLYLKPTLTADKYDENFVKYGTLDLWKQGCTSNNFNGCKRSGDPNRGSIVNPVISARVRTQKSFSFKYGKVEVEAKLPSGDWIWPAIWLLPTEWKYGGWPLSGEIDMMESRGNRNLKQGSRSIGVDSMGATLHWGPKAGLNGFQKTHAGAHAKSGTYGSGFHKYGMEWTDQYIKMYVDGQHIGTFDPGSKGFYYFGQFWSAPNIWAGRGKMAPFDQQFHFIFNVAVGGTNHFFPDNAHGDSQKPWSNTGGSAMKTFYDAKHQWLRTWNQGVRNGEDAAMVINYVKVWQLAA